MIFDDHVRWLWTNIAANGSSELLVVGGVDSGKTTFFEQLAETQPHEQHGTLYRYWNLLDHPAAREPAGFVSVLAQRLRVSGDVGEGDLYHQLPGLLQRNFPGQRIVLILDHWDQGHEYRALCVDVTALSELHRFARSPDSGSGFGLILVSRHPTPETLIRQARLTPESGLARFSGDMQRETKNFASFPHLSRAAAGELLDQLECPRELHDLVYSVCGGWIGLLVEAAAKVSATHSENDLAAALQERVAYMLEKSLLPDMSEKYTRNPADPWDLVMRRIGGGADPLQAFGLPVTESGALPAALLEFRRPAPMLLVDLPHVRAVLTVAGVPDHQIEAQVERVIEFVRHTHDVPVDRIKRLEQNFTPARTVDARVQVVIVSGRPTTVLAEPHPPDVVVAVPGAASPELRGGLPETWRVQENVVVLATGGAHAG